MGLRALIQRRSSGVDPGVCLIMCDSSEPCPRCRALEARVAELERQQAEGRGPGGAPVLAGPFTLRALRLLDHGWGAGWGLRPAPVRRQWMSEHPGSYQC